MKSVGVLITNYQSWPLTEKAVQESLRWSANGISKIVVVDDASDAPGNFPAAEKIFIHRNAKNLGYVRSVNVGMRLLDDEIVLLLDCDAYPLMDLVPRILAHFQSEPQLGALGIFELDAHGKARIAGEPEPTLAHFIFGQALALRFARRGWFVDKRMVLYSCCMAVRRKAFEQIGGFDEAFDFLDADTDFSMRLQDAGWLVKTDSSLQCFHRGSGSPQTTARRVVRHHRNRWLLLRKHGKVQSPSICRFLLKARHVFEWSLLSMAKLLHLRTVDEMEDKLSGRRQLLRSVSRDYTVD